MDIQQQQINTQSIGTGYSNQAITREKITVLTRKNPNIGKFLEQTFGTAVSKINQPITPNVNPNSQNASADSLDRYTKNVIQTLFSAENALNQSVGGSTNKIAAGISGIGTGIEASIGGVKQDLNKLLKPVSSFTGSTLGTLTNVLKTPLGAPELLAGAIGNVVDKISPNFTNRMDATFKKLKIQEFQHMPAQLMGSVRNLAAMADKLLSVPFSMAADLYNGVLQIMQSISKMLDSVVSSVLDLFFGPNGLLDSLIPVGEILSFLEAVGEITSFIGQIGGMFGGFSMITDITSQIDSFTSQATSILSNPAQLAQSYLPPQVGQFTGALRNPEQFLNKMLPSSIQGQFQNIGKIPGLGFVGNFGYGLGGTLEGLKSGVFTNALNSLQDQAGILAPLFGKQSNKPPVADTQQNNTPEVKPSSINPNIPVVQGVPIQTSPKPKVLPDFTSLPPEVQQAISNRRKNMERSWGIPSDPGPFKMKTEDKVPDYLKVGGTLPTAQKLPPLVMVPSPPKK